MDRESLARRLGQLIFCSALVTIAVSGIPYGSIQFWWASFFEIGVFVITILWAIEAMLGGGFRPERLGWLVIPALALILFALFQAMPLGRFTPGPGLANYPLSYTISADPFETYAFARMLGALTLLGAILLRFTTDRRRLRALLLTVIGVGVASAAFGLMRQAMQHEQMGFVLPALPGGIGYGQIINRNQFAFMMEMALGAALGMVIRRRGRYEESLVYLSLALPVGAALILVNSRGGILTLTCQLLFLSLLVMTGWRSMGEPEADRAAYFKMWVSSLVGRALLIVALLSIVSVAVVWVGGERVVSNLSTVGEELAPESAEARLNVRRVEIWRATLSMIKEHPLAGTGFGGYLTAIPQYHDASGAFTPQQAHNDYLELLASGGLISFAIFLWFLAMLIRRARKILRDSDSFRRAVCVGALTGLAGVAVHSFFDFGLHLPVNAALAVALVVAATADVSDDAEKAMKPAGF